jgi:hypothetical protein
MISEYGDAWTFEMVRFKKFLRGAEERGLL